MYNLNKFLFPLIALLFVLFTVTNAAPVAIAEPAPVPAQADWKREAYNAPGWKRVAPAWKRSEIGGKDW